MLTADILAKQEKRGEAIKYGQRALKIAIEESDYSLQSRIYGFLSTQYRFIGFYDKGKKNINKGIEVSESILDKEQVVKYRALSYRELAEYEYLDEDYDKAIDYLKLSSFVYKEEENLQLRYFNLANVEEMLGRCYKAIGKDEEALVHFSRANVLINKAEAENSLWAGVIYRRLGEEFLQSKNLDSTKIYLQKAFAISKKNDHMSLREVVYKSLADYHKQKQDLDSLNFYNKKYSALLTQNKIKNKRIINRAFNMLNEEPKNDNSNAKFYIIIGVLAFLLIIGVYHNRKNILQSLNVNFGNANTKSTEVILSKKTYKELVKKLKAFEASNDFLNKNMSLSMLIGQLNTNAKYLRYILTCEKHTDYNSYINQLRVNYIVEKLKTNHVYSTYKISYLAKESGFSSHSKFSASFKNVTGLSPSEFIEDLKEDEVV